MSHLIPDDPQGAAIWLLEVLDNIQPSELYAGLRQGYLPGGHDFSGVIAGLDAVAPALVHSSDANQRRVTFATEDVGVYESLGKLLHASVSHRRKVPSKFILLNSGYRYSGDPAGAPPEVRKYFDMIHLVNILCRLCDYDSAAGKFVNFVVRPDAKFRVELNFSEGELIEIPGIGAFTNSFLESEFHAEEKRDIVRDCLADVAKGVSSLSLAAVALAFEVVMKNARASYALLLSKFSASSVQKDVDKQNLEDTLRLNKTFSEIQNQLLALPAAILVAGAAFETGKVYKNSAVFVGVAIFVVLMVMLIRNQRNSVAAISAEIGIRKKNLNGQPDSVAQMYLPAFDALERRAGAQLRTLVVVMILSFIVFAFAAYAALDSALSGDMSRAIVRTFKLIFCVH